MKTKDSIIGWAFILSLILILLLIIDILALHDINRDYVSIAVAEDLYGDNSDKLPEWASTKLEWMVLRISLLLKGIISPILIIALARAVRKLKL